MPRHSAWIIDPPSPFAPRDEWEAFLASVLEMKKTHRTRAFDEAIARARRIIADGPDAYSDPARVARYRELLQAEIAAVEKEFAEAARKGRRRGQD